jgi:uncharacterized protein YndB with AHSA1/START domain
MSENIEVTVHEQQEDAASTKLERTFVVAVPVERVWRTMTHPKELAKWSFPRQVGENGSMETEILGAKRTSEVVEFEPGRMFRTRTALTGRRAGASSPARAR